MPDAVTIFAASRALAERMRQADPEFFRLSRLQERYFLWIGCSGSRMTVNQTTGFLKGFHLSLSFSQ